MIQILEVSRNEVEDSDLDWSCGLWWPDFEEAEIESCYIAISGDKIIGFQTVNGNGLCVAIEVRDEYLGQGVATMLVAESGCYRPESDECPDFWAVIEEKFGVFA